MVKLIKYGDYRDKLAIKKNEILPFEGTEEQCRLRHATRLLIEMACEEKRKFGVRNF